MFIRSVLAPGCAGVLSACLGPLAAPAVAGSPTDSLLVCGWFSNNVLRYTADGTFLETFAFRSESEVIGRTDADLVPRYLAESYLKDDQQVMRTGEPMSNKVELVPDLDGTAGWYVTSKVALRDGRGAHPE